MLPEKQPLLSTIVQSSEVYKDDLQHPGLWLGLCLTFYSQLQWLVVQLVVYRDKQVFSAPLLTTTTSIKNNVVIVCEFNIRVDKRHTV